MTASPLSPGQLGVLVARLSGIAEEMGVVLRRSAFSPNIKERADSSAAVFTAEGELLAQAAHIPVHLGAMPASVRAAIARLGPLPTPGCHCILNDPFSGGTHLNDITLVSPVHLDGRLVGWVANRAHHADVGGAAPGSMPADATELAQEGLCLPPMVLTEDVRRLVAANSRTPAERLGDLDAQVGANVIGAARLVALVRTGAPLMEVISYGERRMRAALEAIEDGAWQFTDRLDSTGAGLPGAELVVRLTARRGGAGPELCFDFTGCAPQSSGNVNAVEAVTLSSVAFAVRSVFDPHGPANAGALRAVRVIAPPGSIVAALPPAAVAAGNVEVSQRVADLCLGALAMAMPGRVAAAGQGTMNNVLLGGQGPAGPWVYYETIAGGQGGAPGSDGMHGVHTAMTNTRNTPIEALERAFPLRVRRLRLRQGSGGAGRWRGGEGIERDVEVLAAATLSLITERRQSQPWGLDGGGPGAAGENWLLPGGDERGAVRLADKATVPLRAGDVVRLRTPGGGGAGPVGP